MCVRGGSTHPGLITQSERVEGAHGEQLSVRSPGHCSDGVLMRSTGEQEPPVAVPHLEVRGQHCSPRTTTQPFCTERASFQRLAFTNMSRVVKQISFSTSVPMITGDNVIRADVTNEVITRPSEKKRHYIDKLKTNICRLCLLSR